MPRVQKARVASVPSEAAKTVTVDKINELQAANGVEKNKRNRAKKAEKAEDEVVVVAATNGASKGRGAKKNPNPKEEPTAKLAEKKKLTRKAKITKPEIAEESKPPIENGDVVEDIKPKGVRAKKATQTKKAETKKETESTVAVDEKDAVLPKTKAKRGNKKVEEAVAKPTTSAASKGQDRRKEPSAEPAAVAIEKKIVRGKKRSADEPSEVAAVSSKTAKKEKTVPIKKKTTKAEVKKLEKVEIDEENQNTKEKPTKSVTARKRGATKKANDEDDDTSEAKPSKVKKALLNPTETIYNKADFELAEADNNSSNVSNSSVERKQLKISSWNVAGLRSWLKKDGLKFLEFEDPDIFCMQEIKCTTDQMPEEVKRIPGYHPYWLCLPGGYAGVALYSKIMPINVEYGIGNDAFDDAGRLITAEYEKFFLLNVYVPNSGRKLVNLEARMRWEKLFQEHVKKLDARKPVIICGDMNVSHTEIDLANPKTNTRSAGFTMEEREKMTELLALGFLDTFRQLYPKKLGAYTYWTYMANARSRNVGWRLDYFLVAERIGKRVIENAIRSQVMGSDHCPITLFINI